MVMHDHHGNGRTELWVKGSPGRAAGVDRRRQLAVLHAALRRPERLDRGLAGFDVDWPAVAELLVDGYLIQAGARAAAGAGAGPRWSAAALSADSMPRFTRAELEAFTGATLPDLLGPHVRLLFVGINPGLLTVAVQAHFARRGNRFYPALRPGRADRPRHRRLAGLAAGGSGAPAGPRHRHHQPGRQGDARADQLTPAELTAGAAAVDGAGRSGSSRRWWRCWGSPPSGSPSGNRRRWSAGNRRPWPEPSCGWCPTRAGSNAHYNVDSLAAAYREVGVAAGLVPPG